MCKIKSCFLHSLVRKRLLRAGRDSAKKKLLFKLSNYKTFADLAILLPVTPRILYATGSDFFSLPLRILTPQHYEYPPPSAALRQEPCISSFSSCVCLQSLGTSSTQFVIRRSGFGIAASRRLLALNGRSWSDRSGFKRGQSPRNSRRFYKYRAGSWHSLGHQWMVIGRAPGFRR
jgi:hypothetical protein